MFIDFFHWCLHIHKYSHYILKREIGGANAIGSVMKSEFIIIRRDRFIVAFSMFFFSSFFLDYDTILYITPILTANPPMNVACVFL